MKRQTVIAYIKASEFQMRKALFAAASCKEITDKEYLMIRKALINVKGIPQRITKEKRK